MPPARGPRALGLARHSRRKHGLPRASLVSGAREADGSVFAPLHLLQAFAQSVQSFANSLDVLRLGRLLSQGNQVERLLERLRPALIVLTPRSLDRPGRSAADLSHRPADMPGGQFAGPGKFCGLEAGGQDFLGPQADQVPRLKLILNLTPTGVKAPPLPRSAQTVRMGRHGRQNKGKSGASAPKVGGDQAGVVGEEPKGKSAEAMSSQLRDTTLGAQS